MVKDVSDLSPELRKKLFERDRENLGKKTEEKINEGDFLVLAGGKDYVCRAFVNTYAAVVVVRKKYKRRLEAFLKDIEPSELVLDKDMPDRILDALGIDKNGYLFRGGDEEMGRHGCRQKSEWICTSDTFQPFKSDIQVDVYKREYVGWRHSDDFDDKLFRVMSGTQVAGYSTCKKSSKVFEEGKKTYALRVGTNEVFRDKGIGKTTATANIRKILENNSVAYGAVEAANPAAIAVARDLGFVFTGGELTIKNAKV